MTYEMTFKLGMTIKMCSCDCAVRRGEIAVDVAERISVYICG